MAINFNKENLDNKSVAFGSAFSRNFGIPLDATSLYGSYADAVAYATNPTSAAYVGQEIAVITQTYSAYEDEEKTIPAEGATVIDTSVTIYVINNAAGDLKEVGTVYNDEELRNLIATKLEEVTGKDAIVATPTDNSVEVSLKLAQGDKAGNVTLTQDTNGLKAEVDLSNLATKAEIPTDLGVLSITGDKVVTATPTKGDVVLETKLDNSGNIKFSKTDDGLKGTVDLSNYATKDELPTDFGVTSIITSDDGVVELTPETTSSGAVTITGAHALKGPADGYTSGNTTTSIGTGTSSIKIPQLTVDAYGHVTAASDETISISIPAAPAVPEYSIVKDNNSGDYAAVYHLTKDGTNVGAAINIPKDMVVKSGSVVEIEANTTKVSETDEEFLPAGTYIKIEFQNQDTPVYINAASLIEYVTSGSAATDMVVVAIDANHQVTATITDGTITKAKLDSSVQASLDLADSALQASDIANLIRDQHTHANKALLDTYTQTEENLADAVAKKHTHANSAVLDNLTQAVIDNSHTHANKTVIDGITADLVEQWSAAEVNVINGVSSEFNVVTDDSKDRVLEIAQIAATKIVTGTDSSNNSITLDDTITAITSSIEAIYKAGEGENPATGVIVDLIGTAGTPEVKDDEGNITQAAIPGTGIFADIYSKEEITSLIQTVTGGQSAGEVQQELRDYKTDNDAIVKGYDKQDGTHVDGLVDKVADLIAVGATKVEASSTNGNIKIDGVETTVYTLAGEVYSSEEKEKLVGIEPGAEVNVLEGIRLGSADSGVLVILDDKTTVIPVATKDSLGIVKSVDIETEIQDGETVITNAAAIENKVSVKTDGTMEVNRLNANRLVQTTGEWLILNGGNAALN